MAESRGISIIRFDDTSILFLFALWTAADAKITGGAATMRIFEVQPSDGTLQGYDFADNTFKTGVPATPSK